MKSQNSIEEGLRMENMQLRKRLHELEELQGRMKEIEEQLDLCEIRYSSLVSLLPNGVFHLNEDGTIEDFIPGMAGPFGIIPSRWIGKRISDLVPPHLAQEFKDASEESLRTGNPIDIQIPITLDRGEQIFKVHLAPSPKGGIVAVACDVTGQIHAEAQLRQQAQLLNSVQEAIVATDLKGNVVYWGRGAENLYGYREDEVLGKPFTFALEPGRERENLSRNLEEEKPGFWEEQGWHMRKNGEIFFADARVSLATDESGKPVGFIGIDRDITERKLTEEKLNTVVENLPIILWMIDSQGVITHSSGKGLASQGLRSNEVVGKSIFDHYQDHPEFLENVRRALAGEAFTADNETFGVVYERMFQPIFDLAGAVTGVIGVSTDITERKKAEEALRENESRLQNFINSSPSNLGHVDKDLIFRQVNQGYLEFIGKPEEQVIGHSIAEVIGEEPFAKIRPYIDQVLQGQHVKFEVSRPMRDLGVRHLEFHYVPDLDPRGNVVGFFASAQDITQRKLAEEALQKSESRLQNFINSSPSNLTHVDKDLVFRQVNQGYLNFIGKPEEQVIGHSIAEVFGEESFAQIRPYIEEVLQGRELNFEVARPLKDLGVRHLEVHYLPDRDLQGNVVGFFASAQDITQRKQAEEALRDSRDQLRLVIDNIPAMVSYFDPDLRFKLVNRAAASWYDCSQSDLVGHPISEKLEAQSFNKLQGYRAIALAGNTVSFEEEVLCPDGKSRSVQVNLIPDIGADGTIRGVYSLTIDITQRKQAEEALLRSESRLQNFINSSPSNLTHVDKDLIFRQVNQGYLDVIGKPREKVVGYTIVEVLGEDYFAQVRPCIEKVLQGRDVKFEVSRPLSDKGVRHLEVRYVPDRDRQGNVVGFFASAQDITQRKQAEEALRERERLLKTVIANAPISIFVKDLEGRYLIVNKAFEKMNGFSPEEALGKTYAEIGHGNEELFRRVIEEDRQLLKTGETIEFKEVLEQFQNGEKTWRHVVKVPLHDDSGKIVGLVGCAEDITRQKLAVDALRNSERIMKKAEEVAHFGSLELDMLSGKQYWSDELFRISGHDPRSFEPTAGKFSDLLHPEDKQNVLTAMKESFRTGKEFDLECRLFRTDGTYRTVHVLGEVERDESGKNIRLNGTVHDITERKKAEDELRESRARLQNFIDLSPINLIYIDRNFRYRQVNAGYLEFIGKTKEEVIGSTVADVLGKEIFEMCGPRIEKVFQGKQQCFELARPLGNRGLRNLEIYFVPDLDPQGQVSGFFCSVNDITERKRIENEIRESEKRLRLLTDSVPVLISYVDTGERYLFSSATHARWMSSTPEELIGRKTEEVWSPEAYARMHPYMKRAFAGERIEFDSEFTFPDGKTRLMHTMYIPDIGEDGVVRGYSTMGEDITERRKAEEKLLFNEQRFRDFAESASNWFWEMGPDLRFTYFSPRLEEVVGVPVEFYLGKTRQEIAVIDEDPKRWERHFRDLEERRPFHDFRYWRKGHDSRLQYLSTSGKPIFGDKGEFLGYRGVGRDLTTAKTAEELIKMQEQQLVQADKMSSLGILVSGVAHEINNPNNFIMFNTPILTRIWDDVVPILKHYQEEGGDVTLATLPFEKASEAVSRLLSGISSGAERIRNIVTNLKRFARQDDTDEFEPVNINDVLESTLMLITSEINKSTRRFSLECEEGIPPFKGNFQKMEQVVINLITNACQALPDMDKAVRVKSEYDPKRKRIRLTVTDEGHGISQDNLKKIMDPFFTTKRDSGGTGLGLSVSYSIIKEHQGYLEFSSTEGEGTTALISLPVFHPS